jgi:UDP-N-acetyl-D-mannosaminuronate dehydrogenase
MTQLAEKIAYKSALVGIVGLGYVGLPLARAIGFWDSMWISIRSISY